MGGAAGVQTILGSNLAEFWHCQSGVALSGSAVSSWTGKIRGIALTPYSSNTAYSPTYGADGSLYRGKSVLNFTRAGTQGLQASLGTHIGTTSDHPELIALCRVKTAIDEGSGYNILNIIEVQSDTWPYAQPAYTGLPGNVALGWCTNSASGGTLYAIRAGYFYVSESFTGGGNDGNQGTYGLGSLTTTVPHCMSAVGNITPTYTNGIVQAWVDNTIIGLCPKGGNFSGTAPSGYIATHPMGPTKNYYVGAASPSAPALDFSLAALIHAFNPLTDDQRTAIYNLWRGEFGF